MFTVRNEITFLIIEKVLGRLVNHMFYSWDIFSKITARLPESNERFFYLGQILAFDMHK